MSPAGKAWFGDSFAFIDIPSFGSLFRGGQWGGRKTRRGDVRAAILAILLEQPRNGYQIIQDIERRSRGLWRPSAGAVYPALQQLQDEALVDGKESGSSRIYSLTDAGRAYAVEHQDELRAPWAEIAEAFDDDTVKLHQLIAQVTTAAVQVSQAGSAQRIAAARELLAQTRRGLYRLLADDDDASDSINERTPT